MKWSGISEAGRDFDAPTLRDTNALRSLRMIFVRQLVLAILVSFGLSLFFWLGLGVFSLPGFLVVSSVCALVGAAGGYFAHGNYWVTAGATAIIRVIAYLTATGGFTGAN